MDIARSPAAPAAWLQALDAVISAAQRRPFEWGVHDCCTIAPACRQARTGTDPLAGLAWESQRAALQVLKDERGLRAAVTRRLGEPVGAMLAAPGDIVMAVDPLDDSSREILAVCVGHYLVAPSIGGLASLPLECGVCAWKAASHG